MLSRFDPFHSGFLHRDLAWDRRYMAADVYREGDEFFLEIDVPGVDHDKIDVEIDKNTLTITVDRPYQGSEDRTNLVRGRAFGTHKRRFYLGEGLDSDGIEAAYDNGVLRLSIPVLESAQPRKVEVGAIRDAIEAS